ncbi:carboxymuconolactone decarboxylase family protein [Niastella caeni]|uniref:Carboxymuconolactone decarboxylase family protein n=1 Tax=Niastella caeni TaxID=2569763 RepID=A0A4S8HXS4_9BACT|nr:carboxymuconolactone decarboxylase family protein [Niastella caeni]THU40533.1 carboxymuconolactone decarboxylase family protein [Niastella caeni]
MSQTINVHEKGQRALKSLNSLGAYLHKSVVEQPLLHLIYYRVSQLNGCAFCLDMHSKDLLAGGETTQRLLVLDAWREAPFYTERERAALALAEALTKLKGGHVDAATHEAAREQFSDEELIDLTFAIIAINSYNRVNIAFPNPAMVGTYTPGQYA